MNLLLDTHVFLWLRFSPNRISRPALAAYENDSNYVFLSLVSIWEMQIKRQLGKLELYVDLGELVRKQCETNDIRLLAIELSHILDVEELPFHHKYPFDRLLIAQARQENMVLVSSDGYFSDYEVDVLW